VLTLVALQPAPTNALRRASDDSFALKKRSQIVGTVSIPIIANEWPRSRIPRITTPPEAPEVVGCHVTQLFVDIFATQS